MIHFHKSDAHRETVSAASKPEALWETEPGRHAKPLRAPKADVSGVQRLGAATGLIVKNFQ